MRYSDIINVKKLKKYSFVLFVLGFVSSLSAQIGGEATYQFMTLPSSSRVSALANTSIAVWDHDLNLSLSNPSLLDSSMSQNLALSYADYIADINYGTAAYSYHIDNIGTFAVAINYMHYGDFIKAEANGLITGDFSASDYAFNMIYAKALMPNLQIGVNIKFLYSDYYQYYSSGIAFDAGLTYHNDQKKNSLALVVSNLGHQIKPYREGNYESLPFDVQLAFAQRLNHAPFRFLVSLHHLHNWKLAYESPLDDNASLVAGEEKAKKSTFDQVADESIRHLNLGVELIPVKNFYLRAGYNFQRMKEMVIADKFGMVGFSFGSEIRLYKFRVSYSRAVYHVAGATNTFSISSNLGEFF